MGVPMVPDCFFLRAVGAWKAWRVVLRFMAGRMALLDSLPDPSSLEIGFGVDMVCLQGQLYIHGDNCFDRV